MLPYPNPNPNPKSYPTPNPNPTPTPTPNPNPHQAVDGRVYQGEWRDDKPGGLRAAEAGGAVRDASKPLNPNLKLTPTPTLTPTLTPP